MEKTVIISPEWRSQRFNMFSQKYDLTPLPLIAPLSRPVQTPTFRTSTDDSTAEDLLRRQRQISESQNSGSFRKAFTPKKKTWDSKEIFSALASHVSNGGSAGVAEALIDKLELTGGNVNAPKAKSGLLSRKRSMDLAPQRSQILLKAVENGQVDMVQVLLPHADANSMDASLPAAVARNGDGGPGATPNSSSMQIVELLLRYGASVVQTTEGRAAFRQACAAGGRDQMVAMMMNSPGRPSFDWVNRGMIDAATTGCLPTVRRLVEAGADANADKGAALKAAIHLTRRDMALALLTSAKPPVQPGLNEAFLMLFSHSSVGPSEKLEMAEMLLLAGANGDEVANSLVQSCKAEFFQMVQLLLAFGASIEYQDAFAVRDAVKRGRIDMVQLLLGSNSPLSPLLASECVALIPRTGDPENRRAMLDLLLRRGATGKCLHEALIDAAQSGDVDTAMLLLNPIFPDGDTLAGQVTVAASTRDIATRHDVATVDYKAGQALFIAVTQANTVLVKLMLGTRPSAETLATVFPESQKPRQQEVRYEITEAFLATGLSGPVVNQALQEAMEIPGSDRDGKLVALFLAHKPDINFNGGSYMTTAVALQDVNLLKDLLSMGPAAQAIANALPVAMEIAEPQVRLEMIKLLLAAGASSATALVSEALVKSLQIATSHPSHNPQQQRQQPDERLISMLLKLGKADINHNGGIPVAYAIQSHSPAILDLVLRSGAPSNETLERAVVSFTSMPNGPAKASKLECVLSRYPPNLSRDGAISDLLVHEVETALKMPPGNRSFGLVKTLLVAGGNVNVKNAKVLQEAVRCADQTLVDMIFNTPTTAANSPIAPGTDRMANGGIGGIGSNDSITNPNTAPNITTTHPTHSHNRHAVTATSIAHALPRALMIGDPMDRLVFTQRLLVEGAAGHDANEALIFAVRTYPDDVSLIRSLVDRADLVNGEALATAVKTENIDALELVLRKAQAELTLEVLESVFVDATTGGGASGGSGNGLRSGIGSVKRRGEMDRGKRLKMCEMLLQAGVKDGRGKGKGSGPGSAVVADALITAGEEADLEFAALLLGNGADVDHKEGQAVIAACRSGAADVLVVLVGGARTPARMATLARGFQAATEVGDLQKREAVFKLLLENRVEGDIVDAQLVSSVRFVEKGLGLVKLLLKHGASVDYNSGEAVWTATRSAHLPALKLLLGIEELVAVKTRRRPNAETLSRALKASNKLSPDNRYTVTDWLFQAGLPANDEVDTILTKVVNEEVPDEKLIALLLLNGASPLTNGCKSFVDATRRLLPGVLDMFMKLDVPKSDISWIFAGAFMRDTVTLWLNQDGLEVARTLLQRGADGDGPASALVAVVDIVTTTEAITTIGPEATAEVERLANCFIDMLLDSGVDVDYEHGLALQKAAARGDVDLIERILKGQPNSDSISNALPHIFSLELSSEDEALGLIRLFTDYHVGGQALDVTVNPAANNEEQQPILFRALSKYPRSTSIIEALLEAGYYHDQTTSYIIYPDIDEAETITLLLWTILQPQKRISSDVILTLLNNHLANPNFSSKLTHTTPLMAAISAARPDIVKDLLIANADPTALDFRGNTPLSLAAAVAAGDAGKVVMRMLLKINPSCNDGSLHRAAARLDCDMVELLLDAGHEADFPSTMHQGRSALAELVLHAADVEGVEGEREKRIERVVGLLLRAGSDTGVKDAEGCSVLLLALQSRDPVPITRALLKCGVWKEVNDQKHWFKDQVYLYSPTQYLLRVRGGNRHGSTASRRGGRGGGAGGDGGGSGGIAGRYTEQLVRLLKDNRATDMFYAHGGGPQPADAVGLPEDFEREEKERRRRMARIADGEEDHALTIRRTRELATVQQQVWTHQADLEDSRQVQRRRLAIETVRETARVQDEVFAGELGRERARREAALKHEGKMLEAGVARADAERGAEEGRRRKMLEWDVREGETKMEMERKMRAVRVGEREEIERVDKRMDERVKGRMLEQRRLIESQQRLAGQLQGSGMGGSGPVRRQIGYVTDVD